MITVVPTVSPDSVDAQGNDPNSSYTAWQANSLTALQAGTSTAGTANTPSYYSAQNSTNSIQNITTSSDFASWLGLANPAAPFSNETGNQVRYGVVITATAGSTFTLNELGFMYSDPSGTFSFDSGAGFYSSFGTEFVGFDGSTAVTDPNAPLTKLYGAGSGLSVPATCIVGDPNYDCTPAGEEALLNATAALEGLSSDVITGEYYLTDPTLTNIVASGSADFTVTPEPSTWFLMISAVPVLGAIRRRRQQRS